MNLLVVGDFDSDFFSLLEHDEIFFIQEDLKFMTVTFLPFSPTLVLNPNYLFHVFSMSYLYFVFDLTPAHIKRSFSYVNASKIYKNCEQCLLSCSATQTSKLRFRSKSSVGSAQWEYVTKIHLTNSVMYGGVTDKKLVLSV